MSTKPRVVFSPRPGIGFLTFDKPMGNNVWHWSGAMCLPDGSEGRAEALEILEGKTPHYEVKISRIPENKGDPWKTVSEFKLKPFGKKHAQLLNIPNLGKGQIVKGVAQSGRSKMTIKILTGVARGDREIT